VARATLDTLGQTHNLRALAERVRAICEQYGPVQSYDCIRLQRTDDEEDVFCLVRLASDSQQSELIRDLGARRFGDGVYLKIAQQGKRP
jgi:hypothetical protein